MKKKLVSILALILALIMLLGTILPVILQADQLKDNLENLEGQQGQIQEQIDEKKDEIAALKKKLDGTIKQVDALDAQIMRTEEEMSKLSAQIDESTLLLEATEEELALAETESADYYEVLKYRIKAMYESKDATYLEILLQSESISDFFCRLEYVSQMMEYDRMVMDNLEEASRIIAEKKALIEVTLKQQQDDKAALETKQQNLSKQHSDKTALVNQIKEESNAAEIALGDLETMGAEVEKKIKQTEAAIEKKRKEEEERRRKELEALKQQQQNQADKEAANNSAAAGFVFSWPLKGYTYLSSQFGPRTHPITGKYTNHSGTDIPAPRGTKITSVESGVVVTAKNSGWNGGYGQYVMINHGNGYVSLYAHCSKVLVKEGQWINKGDVIAEVGTTGSSTGNHLHLELRIDGKRVDPELWIPKK